MGVRRSCFESAEAEKEDFEREQQEERMWERIAENIRASKELDAMIKELKRDSKHRG